MQKSSITHAKNNFSQLIKKVRRGQSILITDRNQPVARLDPVAPLPDLDRERIERLERQGLITRPRKRLTSAFFKLPRGKSARGHSVLQALLDERAEGR